MTPGHIAGGLVVALLAAGCSGQRLSLTESGDAAPERADMPGRWILAAPHAPSCGMNFAGASGAQNGRIVPEGGCPGRFYMSRRWTLEQGALLIADQENNALARLSYTEGRFGGQSTDGIPVSLSPDQLPP